MKVELINLAKSFLTKKGRVEVFYDLNFVFNSGEFVVILGPNGCGKTTLLNLINGLDKEYTGEIKVQSENGHSMFAYMMQKDLLLPWRTVYENIILGLEIQGGLTGDTYGRVIQYLERFEIADLINEYPAKLSGGERQKVALVRTLIMESDILLLDEPFSSIDYNTRIELQSRIYSFVKETKKTAILVTHDIDEAIALGDRVIVFDHKPLGILKEFKIDLKKERDPITARQESNFASYFSEIWKSLPKEKKV